MTKTISNGKSQKNNLNANEDFVMFLTSKLITCFIDNVTFRMKSQSITCLLTRSARIYCILDLEGEVHSIMGFVDKRPSRCKGNVFLTVGQGGQQFTVRFKRSPKNYEGLPQPASTSPQKLIGGRFNVPFVVVECLDEGVCVYQ